MNHAAKSAVFGLNWLQEAKTGNEATPAGSYDAKREVWTTTDEKVLAGSSTVYTSFYSGTYSGHYTAVVVAGGVLCDAGCDSLCGTGCDW
jgi:hypothetical protein